MKGLTLALLHSPTRSLDVGLVGVGGWNVDSLMGLLKHGSWRAVVRRLVQQLWLGL